MKTQFGPAGYYVYVSRDSMPFDRVCYLGPFKSEDQAEVARKRLLSSYPIRKGPNGPIDLAEVRYTRPNVRYIVTEQELRSE